MESGRIITVFGAYGHTGRFVVSELHKRGWRAILSGRNRAKLEALHRIYAEFDVRDASVEEPAALDRALAGASAVINCAGPFADTAIPVVEAALRAGIHYLDVAAEQPAVLAVFERIVETARAAHVAVLPAMAFYGGWVTFWQRPPLRIGRRRTRSPSRLHSIVGGRRTARG